MSSAARVLAATRTRMRKVSIGLPKSLPWKMSGQKKAAALSLRLRRATAQQHRRAAKAALHQPACESQVHHLRMLRKPVSQRLRQRTNDMVLSAGESGPHLVHRLQDSRVLVDMATGGTVFGVTHGLVFLREVPLGVHGEGFQRRRLLVVLRLHQ